MKKEITVRGKVYRIKSDDTFRRKNLSGKTGSWKSYRLSKGWITIGLAKKHILWEKQSKLVKGKFNPELSGTLWKNKSSKPMAFVYWFDISKAKFFAVERFPDGKEYRLVGKAI